MNTNVTGFSWFFEDLCVLVLWTKVGSASEGLKCVNYLLTEFLHTYEAAVYTGQVKSRLAVLVLLVRVEAGIDEEAHQL